MLKKLLAAGTFVGVAILVWLVYLYAQIRFDIDTIVHYKPKLTTTLFDKNGKLIANVFNKENRVYVSYSDIPPRVVEALVAIEDTQFFEHPGINVDAISRAIIKDIKAGKLVEGASTLTQQLVKTMVLSREKKLVRKIKEVLLSLRLETILTKEEILERYLNHIFFGHGYYGIRTAALGYFKKDIGQLNLKEIAMLVGIPRAPTFYDPTRNPDFSLTRGNQVIQRMYTLGWINEDEYNEAINYKPEIYNQTLTQNKAPYIVDHVLRELSNDIEDIRQGGYKIDLTIDIDAQDIARDALKYGYDKIKKRDNWFMIKDKEAAKEIITKRLEDIAKYDLLYNEYNASLANEQNSTLSLIDSNDTLNTFEENLDKLALIDMNNTQDQNISDENLSNKFMISIDGEDLNVSNINRSELFIVNINGTDLNISDLNISDVNLSDVNISDLNISDINFTDINKSIFSKTKQLNGSIVVLENSTGKIQAMVGGVDYRQSSFNRATQSQRQPGSAIKPFLYQIALNLGYSTNTNLIDISRTYKYESDGDEEKLWQPRNYEKNFKGLIPLREALVHSRNLATINMVTDIGIDVTYKKLLQYGFSKDIPFDLSITLGSIGISPLELSQMYSIFSNQGVRIKPYIVEAVTNKEGRTISFDKEEKPLFSPEQAFLMTTILRDTVDRGTGRMARVKGVEIAGKTGTTNKNVDAWFCGYSPTLQTLVWYGNDDNRPMQKSETGGRSAGPAFSYFYTNYLKKHPEYQRKFTMPEGVTKSKINGKTEYFTDTSRLIDDKVKMKSESPTNSEIAF